MNVMAITLVIVMAGFVCAAMGVVTWGSFSRLAPTGDWRERALAR